MRPLITILILLVASVATAQPVTVWDLDAGLYLVTVDANGVPVVQPVEVRRPDGTPTPPKPPVVTPDPTDLSTLTSVSRNQYEKIPASDMKPILGATVATVYRSVANGLRDGSTTVAQAAEQIRQIREAMPKDWDLWRAETAKVWNQLQDKGLITSPATWAAGLDAIAAGIASQAVVVEMLESEEGTQPFLGNVAIGELIEMLLKLIGGDGNIGKWLPLILLVLKLILGGL
jgi:hypothetical protein